MRWVRAAISTFAIAALATPQSWAQSRTPMQELEGPTFQSEAVTAVSTNPALAAERARVRAVRQTLPQAWAELLPQVTVDASAIEQDSSEDEFLPAFTIREQPEYWIASVRSSTLLFGSGRVMASTRQARAQIASAVAAYQEAVQNTALEFTQAYAETIYTRAALAAQQESLANLEEQVRFARANQREGFLTRTDVAQAEARVAQSRADVARARARVTEAVQLYTRVSAIRRAICRRRLSCRVCRQFCPTRLHTPKMSIRRWLAPLLKLQAPMPPSIWPHQADDCASFLSRQTQPSTPSVAMSTLVKNSRAACRCACSCRCSLAAPILRARANNATCATPHAIHCSMRNGVSFSV
ncbi:MAG: TolC family protein [Caulobacteraceae bacterium]|nr:TolC family protein [Caulobacteraceae bacterium]